MAALIFIFFAWRWGLVDTRSACDGWGVILGLEFFSRNFELDFTWFITCAQLRGLSDRPDLLGSMNSHE
jgi:hypothetical protein